VNTLRLTVVQVEDNMETPKVVVEKRTYSQLSAAFANGGITLEGLRKAIGDVQVVELVRRAVASNQSHLRSQVKRQETIKLAMQLLKEHEAAALATDEAAEE